MTEAPKKTRAGLGGWAKGLLAVSLALNLLVVGVVVGSHVGDGPKDRRSGPPRDEKAGFDPALGPFARALPDGYREAAVEALRAEAGDFRANRADLAASLEATLALLRADPFDGDALRAQLDAQQDIFLERGRIGRRVVAEQIDAMSAAERADLADRLERGFRHAMDRARK